MSVLCSLDLYLLFLNQLGKFIWERLS